jgi:signal transduction histidine kinase
MAVTAAATAPAQTPAARLRQLGADALYLLTGLVTSIVAFTVWICGVTLSLSLGLLIVGFPIVIASFWCFRLLADLERQRARLVFGLPIASAYRPASDGRLASRLRTAAHDPQRWKDVAYLALHGVLGFVAGTIWLMLVALVVGGITLPAWWWVLPGGTEWLTFTIDTWEEAVGAAAIGVALLPVALFLQRPLALSQAHIAKALLGPSLAARVERLTETRAGAVDAAATELQRIERDLHDGAQARLVALAMDLGMAEERFDRDPDGARQLVGEARLEAKRALAELRDLAREPARGARPRVGHHRARGPQPGACDGNRRRPPQAAAVGRDRGLVRGLRGARERRQAQRGGARRGVGHAAQRTPARRGRRRRPRRRRPAGQRPQGPRAAGRGARRLARGP